MFYAMIIDDEKSIINRLAFGVDWNRNGFEVVATSASSVDAMQMIEFIQPHVIFTDIRMPKMTGLELMKKVRAKLPQIQFVVISGYADFQYAQQALQLGALAYCLKPLETEEIEEALSKARSVLERNAAIEQSSFNDFLRNPSVQTVQMFLTNSQINRQTAGAIAISVGDGAHLLLGNVSFFSVQINSQCDLYLITSNSEFLSSFAFSTALINAAARRQLTSFAFAETQSFEAFLLIDFQKLLNSAFSFFLNGDVLLGRAELQEEKSQREFLNKFEGLVKKNKFADIHRLLDETFPQQTEKFGMTDILSIYNGCDALAERLDDAHTASPCTYCFELAEKYNDLSEMLDDLSRKLSGYKGSFDAEKIKNKALRNAILYINANFTKQISFQQLCEENFVNPSYLSQLFRRELGITFTDYVAKLRIARAKELLLTTNIPITEVSEAVGYDYYFNFTKLFKKEMGCTPKQYRDKYRQ